MAKANGYTCDNPQCAKFLVGDNLPVGWLVLSVALEKGISGTDRMELCSNYCLAEMAVQRTEADGRPYGKTKGRTGKVYRSPESLARAQRNGRRSSHMRFHRDKGVVVPDCEFCQEITNPVAT